MGNFEREVATHSKAYGLSAVSSAETAEPIDLPFGLWTQVSKRKPKFNRIRQLVPVYPHGSAHWRYLANTIEPSVCGGNAVLCQITLTQLL